MQDRASEYPRGDARTLPRRPLAPTQRRIPAVTYGSVSGVTEMDAPIADAPLYELNARA